MSKLLIIIGSPRSGKSYTARAWQEEAPYERFVYDDNVPGRSGSGRKERDAYDALGRGFDVAWTSYPPGSIPTSLLTAATEIVVNRVTRPVEIEPALQPGDVKIGDTVRMKLAPSAEFPGEPGGFVEGEVVETAADGGVVGIRVGGVMFSAGLTSVVKL